MARAPRLPQGVRPTLDSAGAEPADVRVSIEQRDGDSPAEPGEADVARRCLTPSREKSPANQSMDGDPI